MRCVCGFWGLHVKDSACAVRKKKKGRLRSHDANDIDDLHVNAGRYRLYGYKFNIGSKQLPRSKDA